MEYQNVINLLGNTPNQPTKFRTQNWVEAIDGLYGVYTFDSQIKLETSMIRSSLRDYSDIPTYLLKES